jgi:hypothetical protein
MTIAADDPAVDQVRVSVLVEVPPADAFRIFVEDIDLWWRRGSRGIASRAVAPEAFISSRASVDACTNPAAAAIPS